VIPLLAQLAPRALALFSIAALGLAGCKNEGAPYACECDMLTDYDDANREAVKVCAANERDAPAVARGCAQLANPMPVQSCACKPSPGAPRPCREGCLP
jgi:hypothetical protein